VTLLVQGHSPATRVLRLGAPCSLTRGGGARLTWLTGNGHHGASVRLGLPAVKVQSGKGS